MPGMILQVAYGKSLGEEGMVYGFGMFWAALGVPHYSY